MNRPDPKNWTRSIRGLPSGMARFNPRPAKNAPTMPSIEAACASRAHARNATIPKTKRYDASVPTRAKNQRATLGSA